jgi:serine/threonine protein kinase
MLCGERRPYRLPASLWGQKIPGFFDFSRTAMGLNDVVVALGTPEHVGRYRIVERVGRGAMGAVYRARDEAMARDVAIKILAADLEDDPELRVRFLREAQAAARLTHPNIITIFDFGEHDGHSFIVMELLQGATLKEYLRGQSRIPLEQKINLMIQLATGLGAAHRASVYHRDIKPGNLFLRTDGLLKILDFGVARLASSSMTTSGFVVGTPDYMSPEQARGKEVDGRSDIFSAGGVFYFLLTGRKPFAAADIPSVFRQIERNDPPPLAETEAPAVLAQVVMKALAKDRRARYQSCEELVADLSRLQHLRQAEPPPTLVLPETSGETDETIDVALSAADTDDTAAYVARVTWMNRASQHMQRLISSVMPRRRRSDTRARRRPSDR